MPSSRCASALAKASPRCWSGCNRQRPLPRKGLCTISPKYPVIPGCREAAGPEPIFQRPVFMGSGLAAARRPGMTGLFVQNPRKRGRAGVGAPMEIVIEQLAGPTPDARELIAELDAVLGALYEPE